MKKYKLFFSLALGAILTGSFVSCDDFDEINENPSIAGINVVQPYYALNNSIIGAQQSPHEAERIFVYNWAGAARISGENSTFLATGHYSDSFNQDYFNSYLTQWIKNASLAITLADERAPELTSEEEINLNSNIKAFARIWRVTMIAEFTDNFGPYPLDAFNGTNPTFSSEQEVYHFMLNELKEAAANINLSVKVSDAVAKCDPAYGYNAEKWLKYANSMRMRMAMRLSEVDASTAKSHFEDACKGATITSLEDMFAVQEYNQWNAWAGVYSRGWNYITLTSTMSNILTGLGGIPIAEQRPDLAQYAKPMNYLGLKFDQHYAECTDNPTKQYWLDGVPENLDPRALRIYCLPNDVNANNFQDYGSTANHANFTLKDDSGNDLVKIDGQFTWNYYPAGARSAWSPKFAKNSPVAGAYPYVLPVLSKPYVDCSGKRIWFAPWETYFLLAEAALYGWSVGTTAETAYEKGVGISFESFGVSQFLEAYLNSTEYNRIGCSVKFTHTTEPASFTADYVNGYTNAPATVAYQYPDANKALYKGKKLNDQLTKVITQKYIAQTPYGALEMWNDHRRLGLPFFDIPNNETVLTGSDMENTWTSTTYMTGQTSQVFPQRLRYPSSLKNADPEGYAKALGLLGGNDNTVTPLWWAIH